MDTVTAMVNTETFIVTVREKMVSILVTMKAMSWYKKTVGVLVTTPGVLL